MKLEGAVALVTGGNRGLGKVFVRALLDAGVAKVYAAARDPNSVKESGAVPVHLDVTKADQVERAAQTCADVTLLVNNSGVAHFTPLIGAISMQNARDEMEVNYFGMLAMCRAFAPVLGRNGGGAIVNILSVASWVAIPISGSYCASKAAALHLTNGIRVELEAQKTLVVGVHAGFIDTDMAASFTLPKTSPEQVVERTLAAIRNDETEVLSDARSADVKARLYGDPASLEAEMRTIWANRKR